MTVAKNTDSRFKKGSISIVIPAFNEAAYIARTLRSVFQARQHYQGPVEVIVVDNNSSDATAEIARSCGAKLVFEPRNQIARARNKGAEQAIGNYLIFLDADTLIEGKIFDRVNENLSSGRIIGGGAWADPDSSWVGRWVFRIAVNYMLALRNLTVGPFLYCDRKAFNQVGGFDEAFYAAEEFSLARRLKMEGKKDGRKWQIIRYGKSHKITTSNRKFEKFGSLEMAGKNAHLVWKPHQKLKQKEQCKFWYDVRK